MSGYPTGIGDYEVRGTLGTGSSGTVFLARQSLIDRDVALKQLSAELTAQPEFRERFRAEAQIMARLESDHCVRVFDFFEREGHAYLVSEVVAGVSLRKLVESGSLSPEQALGVMKGALLGLDHAHGMGLIHRDIKPENILLDTEGTSKLADFGLAGAVEGPGAAGGLPSGSPAYMSPETVSGAMVDARSDLYSVGAVLFELLTGRPPFLAEGALAVMRMHRQAPVPNPHELNGQLGPGVSGLVMASLAKDAADRPQTAGQMLAALETAAVEAYGPEWETRSSVKREVAAALGAGLGLLALLGTAGAAAAAAAVGSAVTASAAGSGAVLGVSTWLVAAAALGVLITGAGGLALANGALSGAHTGGTAVFAASPSPSPTELLSPSPDVSPSPSDSPSPSPNPSPSTSTTTTQTPTKKTTTHATTSSTSSGPPAPPKPGPITVSGLGMWFTTSQVGPVCHNPCDAFGYRTLGSAYPAGNCVGGTAGAVTLTFYEQYNWSFPGTPGISQPVTVNWSGTRILSLPLHTDTFGASPASQPALVSGPSGSHPHAAPAGFTLAPAPNPHPPDGGQITFALSWTNPNDGTTGSKALPFTFYYGCG
jgi:eukaryotic-like serine/threonine-protein kinase